MNREAEIMHSIEHKHIVQLEEIYDTPKNLYLVLELLTGGELFERIVEKGQYSEKDAANLLREVIEAIDYLHKHKIVHRDMKPENLIYDSNEEGAIIKITDFGLAKQLNKTGEKMNTACGTPGFVAPEILRNKAYTDKVDLWSTGVILYILLCGFPPFYDESTAKLYGKIKRGEYDFPDPYWTDISSEAKDLVKKMLTVDPKKRYSTKQVLEHAWMGKNGASDKPLGSAFAEKLATYNARRKFRRGIQLIIAVDRLTRAMKAEV